MSSEKVSCCDKFCQSITTFWLQFFNVFDSFVGFALITLSVYLFMTVGSELSNYHIAWLIYSSAVLGAFLVSTSFLSCCGMYSKTCRCCMVPSRYFAILNAVLSLVYASIMFGFRSDIYTFVNNNKEDMGFSNSDVDSFKDWYTVIACLLYLLCLTELYRFKLSQDYADSANRMDGIEETLLLEEDMYWNDRLEDSRVQVGEKYDGLKSHYKAKYKNAGSRRSRDADPNECTV